MPRHSFLVPLVVLAACGTSPPEAVRPDGPVERSVDDELRFGSVVVEVMRENQTTTGVSPLPAEQLWPHLADAILDLGFESDHLATYEPSAYQVVVSRRPVRTLGGQKMSRLLDCGRSPTGPRADTHQIHVRLLAWLEPAGDGTLVRTRLEASARRRGIGAVASCGSRGKLELILVDELHERALETG